MEFLQDKVNRLRREALERINDKIRTELACIANELEIDVECVSFSCDTEFYEWREEFTGRKMDVSTKINSDIYIKL